MKTKYIIAANCAIIYGVIIVIINSINVNYALQNTVPEYDPNTGKGCVIKDISGVKNYSIPVIVCACCMILLVMCILLPDTQTSMSEDAACGGMPVCLTLMMYIAIFTVSSIMLSYGDDDYYGIYKIHEPISKFIATGCNPQLMRVIYATLFINMLPGLIVGAGIDCFIVGGILYGIGYIIGKWLGTCCLCCKYKRDANLSQATRDITTRPSPRQNNLDVRINIERYVSAATNTTVIGANQNVDLPPQYEDTKPIQRAESQVSLPPAYDTVIVSLQTLDCESSI